MSGDEIRAISCRRHFIRPERPKSYVEGLATGRRGNDHDFGLLSLTLLALPSDLATSPGSTMATADRRCYQPAGYRLQKEMTC